jgi:hypothetical protein
MTRISRATPAAVALAMCFASVAQQIPDMVYAPVIERPEHAQGAGPTVAIDAAHLNFHTAEERYGPFAKLLRLDGYVVESNGAPFTAETLARFDILVISNAMHPQSEADWAPLPNYSAFTDDEIAAVEKWIRDGGALLLIADHMPLAGHAEALAAAFGVRFQNGFALDSSRNGQITFRRPDGSLAPTPIANGRRAAERVDSVTTFTGQAFRIDPAVDATALLIVPNGYELLLPQIAFEFSERTPRVSAANLYQGATLLHGRGRVAAFGEAAMFSAQLAGPEQRPMGMNAPEARDNYRFALNVLHWLAGTL